MVTKDFRLLVHLCHTIVQRIQRSSRDVLSKANHRKSHHAYSSFVAIVLLDRPTHDLSPTHNFVILGDYSYTTQPWCCTRSWSRPCQNIILLLPKLPYIPLDLHEIQRSVTHRSWSHCR